MKISTEELLQQLIEKTRVNINKIEALRDINLEKLNRKSDEKSWSILECLEHLNRYGNFYIPEIKAKINNSDSTPDVTFKSTWLGNYFANAMAPKEKLNKMNTFKSMNPLGSILTKKVIEEFLSQQHQMIELLHMATKVSLNKVKTSISISKLIKLRLGDTFKVVIYHNDRHVAQVERVKNI